MKHLCLSSIVLAVVLLMAPDGWAAPTLTLTAEVKQPPPAVPLILDVGVRTIVGFTLLASEPGFNVSSCVLKRLDVKGRWKTVTNAMGPGDPGPGEVKFFPSNTPNVITADVKFFETFTDSILLRAECDFKPLSIRVISSQFTLKALTLVPEGTTRTVTGSDTSTVTGEPNRPAYLGIGPLSPGLISLPAGSRPRVATEFLDFEPTPSQFDQGSFDQPMTVTVPAPSGTTTGTFYFAEVVEGPSGTGSGVEQKLLYRDTAAIVSGQITTETGIWDGGTLVVLQEVGSGYVTGTITGPDGNPSPGTWVQERVTENPGNVGTYTDAQGRFKIPVRTRRVQGQDKADIIATAGLRCGKKTVALITVPANATVTQNFSFDREDAALFNPSHPGLRNGGFEKGIATCWKSTGTTVEVSGKPEDQAAGAAPSIPYRDLFGFGTTFQPNEGEKFVALQSEGAMLEQRFLVPAGVEALFVDFAFACQASDPDCTALQNPASLNMQLRAELILPTGSTTTATDNQVFTMTFRDFAGQLGWRFGKLVLAGIRVPNPSTGALEPLPGSKQPIRVKFTATNLNTALASVVLLDNVRFDTAFVALHLLSGAQSVHTPSEVREQVRNANELLAQIGASVRIRRLNPAVSPADAFCNSGSLDFFGTNGTDVTWTTDASTRGVRTAEMRALLCIGPRNNQDLPLSDIHIYYVNRLQTGNSLVIGAAVTPEDYVPEPGRTELNYNASDTPDPFNAGGILMSFMNDPDRRQETLAHELGHLLLHRLDAFIVRPRSSSDLEHFVASGANVMAERNCVSIAASPCSGRVIMIGLDQAAKVDLPDPPPVPATCPVICRQ